MEFVIGGLVGAAACGTIWWFVDSRGGVAAVEKSVLDQAKAEAQKVEKKVQDEVKKVV